MAKQDNNCTEMKRDFAPNDICDHPPRAKANPPVTPMEPAIAPPRVTISFPNATLVYGFAFLLLGRLLDAKNQTDVNCVISFDFPGDVTIQLELSIDIVKLPSRDVEIENETAI
jgi:hypothetical protein